MLHVTSLGKISAAEHGIPLPALKNSRALSLWIYVALNGRRCERSRLATAFWGDLPEAAARSNLRVAISQLRQNLPDHVSIDRYEVAVAERSSWHIDLDLLDRPDLDEDEVRSLVNLRVEDFFASIRLRADSEIDAWATATREALTDRYLERLRELGASLGAEGALRLAAEVWRRTLTLDPWSEPLHRSLIETYARLGQKAAARAQFEACRAMLAREFGEVPGEETLAALRTAADLAQAPPVLIAAPHHDATEVRRRWSPPAPPTESFGRDAELGHACELLAGDNAAVVTVVGLGGSGKTHFALMVAGQLKDRLRDGAVFVDLSDVQPADPSEATVLVWERIAHALSVPLLTGTDPAPLLAGLRDAEALVVLDNYETAIDAAAVASQLARECPGLRILVTSRRPLGLATEWLVHLGGLSLEGPAGDTAGSPAYRLFASVAAQVQIGGDFDCDPKAVREICAAVDGHPLSVALAARWLPVLSCDEIVRRLKSTADQRGAVTAPPVDGIVAATLKMLPERTAAAFVRLGAFAGVVPTEAAEAVGRCSVDDLSLLSGCSLIRSVGPGRLEIHPLIRESCRRRLDGDPDLRSAVTSDHADWICRAVRAGVDRFSASGEADELGSLHPLRSDVFAAAEWLIETRADERLADFVPSLFTLARVSDWFEEVSAVLERIIGLPGIPERLLSYAHVSLGITYTQLGRHAECKHHYAECLRLHGEVRPAPTRRLIAGQIVRLILGRRRPVAGNRPEAMTEVLQALNGLGQISYFEGDLRAYMAYLLEGGNYDYPMSHAATLAYLSHLFGATPLKRLARSYADRALLAMERSNPLERAWSLELLCLYCLGAGDIDSARRHGELGVQLFRRLAQKQHLAECIGLLGNTYILSGDLETGRRIMADLEDEGARLGNVSGEFWGLAASTSVDLRSGRPPPENFIDRASALAGGMIDLSSHLILFGLVAEVRALRGEATAAVEALRLFRWVHGRSTMTGIYAYYGYIAAMRAAVRLLDGDTGDPAAVRKLGADIAAAAGAFGRTSPIARLYALRIEADWLAATGRLDGARRLMQRIEALRPREIRPEGLRIGFTPIPD